MWLRSSRITVILERGSAALVTFCEGPLLPGRSIDAVTLLHALEIVGREGLTFSWGWSQRCGCCVHGTGMNNITVSINMHNDSRCSSVSVLHWWCGLWVEIYLNNVSSSS